MHCNTNDSSCSAVSLSRTMKHRNVLALLGVCQEKNAIMLLLEHCSEVHNVHYSGTSL